jgi:hypothetical protein
MVISFRVAELVISNSFRAFLTGKNAMNARSLKVRQVSMKKFRLLVFQLNQK